MKCVACGSVSLVEGELADTVNGGTLTFKLKAVSVWKSIFGIGTRKIKAYGCVNCYHLQLAVEFSNEDCDRFRQFEGQQPTILERINAEEE